MAYGTVDEADWFQVSMGKLQKWGEISICKTIIEVEDPSLKCFPSYDNQMGQKTFVPLLKQDKRNVVLPKEYNMKHIYIN